MAGGGTNLFLDFESGQYRVIVADEVIYEEEAVELDKPKPTVRLPSGRAAIEEAGNIVELTCTLLLEMPKGDTGRTGSELRAACNYLRVHAERMMAYASDQFPARLALCFQLARDAGATMAQFENAENQTDEREANFADRFCCQAGRNPQLP